MTHTLLVLEIAFLSLKKSVFDYFTERRKYYFICNLRYFYVENLVNENGSIEPLQKLCRLNYGSFYTLQLLLRSLAAIERERLKLDKKFHKVLRIWNAPTTQKLPANSSKNKC